MIDYRDAIYHDEGDPEADKWIKDNIEQYGKNLSVKELKEFMSNFDEWRRQTGRLDISGRVGTLLSYGSTCKGQR